MSSNAYIDANVAKLYRPYIDHADKVNAALMTGASISSKAEEDRYKAQLELDHRVDETKLFADPRDTKSLTTAIGVLAAALGRSVAEVHSSIYTDLQAQKAGIPLPGPSWLKAGVSNVSVAPDWYSKAVTPVIYEAYKLASFYVPTLAAVRPVMDAYKKHGGLRKQDDALLTSIGASPGWVTIADDNNRAALVAAVLGTTPAKVLTVWAAQKDLWKAGKTVSSPSSALSKLAVYPKVKSAGGKLVPVAPPPVVVQPGAVADDVKSGLAKALPWVAGGAVVAGLLLWLMQHMGKKARASAA